LLQVNLPQSLFDAPANLFVATFIGSPAMNLAEAKLVRDQGPALVFADYKIPIPERVIADHPGLDRCLDKPLIIGVRPSSLEDAALAWASELPRIKAEVAVTEELGSEVNVIFPVATPPVLHDSMIAKFDRVAKDHAETRNLAGEGPEPVDRPGRPQDQRPPGPHHRADRRRWLPVLVRPRQRPGHRPRAEPQAQLAPA
jgi:multiple sugar transport system ATP-binding protein